MLVDEQSSVADTADGSSTQAAHPRAVYQQATTMQPLPVSLAGVNASCRNSQPGSSAIAMLPLSMGATVETWPADWELPRQSAFDPEQNRERLRLHR